MTERVFFGSLMPLAPAWPSGVTGTAISRLLPGFLAARFFRDWTERRTFFTRGFAAVAAGCFATTAAAAGFFAMTAAAAGFFATTAAAVGTVALGGAAAIGGARAAGGATLGALRAGTSMGAATSAAYKLGQETSGSSTVGAGLSGVAQAAKGAARDRLSDVGGFGAAAERGERAALMAGARTSGGSSTSSTTGAADEAQVLFALRSLCRGLVADLVPHSALAVRGVAPGVLELEVRADPSVAARLASWVEPRGSGGETPPLAWALAAALVERNGGTLAVDRGQGDTTVIRIAWAESAAGGAH